MNMLNERGHFDHGREVIVSPLKSVQVSEKIRKELERRARNSARIRSQNAAKAKKK